MLRNRSSAMAVGASHHTLFDLALDRSPASDREQCPYRERFRLGFNVVEIKRGNVRLSALNTGVVQQVFPSQVPVSMSSPPHLRGGSIYVPAPVPHVVLSAVRRVTFSTVTAEGLPSGTPERELGKRLDPEAPDALLHEVRVQRIDPLRGGNRLQGFWFR
jgi:hypothetical protein